MLHPRKKVCLSIAQIDLRVGGLTELGRRNVIDDSEDEELNEKKYMLLQKSFTLTADFLPGQKKERLERCKDMRSRHSPFPLNAI